MAVRALKRAVVPIVDALIDDSRPPLTALNALAARTRRSTHSSDDRTAALIAPPPRNARTDSAYRWNLNVTPKVARKKP